MKAKWIHPSFWIQFRSREAPNETYFLPIARSSADAEKRVYTFDPVDLRMAFPLRVPADDFVTYQTKWT